MKTATGKSPRTRAKIIAELASLPSAIQGKICEDKRRLANRRNHTIRIPRDRTRTRFWNFQLANSGYAFSRTNATVSTTPTSENPIATRYASVQGATDVLSFKIWSKR